ncbi:HAD-IIIA family hydrolase [Tersicoccus solisilvae]|uniref:HAD-IIIA family hydrolase n=1 Tax=Tersicoccus solisilvae TaxID=1882339 RepID=UPI00166E654E|nr:HAD-IIIA family hydrolase [Tersicoccus solisilvae]
MTRSAAPAYAVVIPSVGRPSLQRLLDTLAAQDENTPTAVVVVDDRRGDVAALTPVFAPTASAGPVPLTVVRGYGRGPAAARNRGWRVAARTGVTWIAFLDDDVELPAGWANGLAADLASCGPGDAATQGRIHVPLPADRRPTDWERNTAALMDADWATADMAYRVAALEQVGGFDERFPRAFREDADLALRVRDAGWTLRRGQRSIVHPVRPADAWVSHRVQAGNADDALMRRLHGPDWRARAEAPAGGFRRHVATVVAAATGVLGAAIALDGLVGGAIARSVPAADPTAGQAVVRRAGLAALAAGTLAWGGLTARFLRLRMGPGPRPGDPGYRDELTRMAVTSATIPVAAVAHHVRGVVAHRRTGPWPRPVRAVLVDRDGTLVRDVPYNGDPTKVEPMPGAVEAARRVRAAGLPVGLVSNQSGIGRGLLTRDQVDAVNARVAELVGGLDTVRVCPHAPEAGCACRKPRPGLILAAAADLSVDPAECVVIGDIGADVEAAQAAGARAVLVPTDVTLPTEIDAAPAVARDLLDAVTQALGAAEATVGTRTVDTAPAGERAGV